MKRFQKIIFYALLGFLFPFFPAYSVIDKVFVSWNADLCVTNCPSEIQEKLSQLEMVESVDVDEKKGVAFINWKSKKPFEYDPIRQAMGLLGVTVRTVGMIVTGSISQENGSMYLTSTEDNTKLQLDFNPTEMQMDFIQTIKPVSIKAPPDIKDRLLKDMETNRVVEIGGFILFPRRPIYRITVDYYNPTT